MKRVVLRRIEINQFYNIGSIVLAVKPTSFDSVLEHVHKDGILSNKRIAFNFFKTNNRGIDSPPINAGIDSHQSLFDYVGQKRIVKGVRRSRNVRAVEMLIAMLRAQMLNYALFKSVFIEQSR